MAEIQVNHFYYVTLKMQLELCNSPTSCEMSLMQSGNFGLGLDNIRHHPFFLVEQWSASLLLCCGGRNVSRKKESF
jgi:hypothetical protein